MVDIGEAQPEDMRERRQGGERFITRSDGDDGYGVDKGQFLGNPAWDGDDFSRPACHWLEYYC